MLGLWATIALCAQVGASQAALRAAVGETALRQAHRMDARWQPAQRDCAGLVRHAYRVAFDRLDPSRARRGLWRSANGEPLIFADAQTLLMKSFRFLGRDDHAADTVRTGDLLAFRQDRGAGEDAAYHLMLAVAPTQHLHAGYLVYHPGTPGDAVRAGPFAAYVRYAPAEWQPTASNPAFLGFYRFEDWNNELQTRP